MPPPRRREAPPPQSEGKAGLVIALVFFILTTLIAGTLAYLFNNDAAKAMADKKKAEDDAKTFKDDKADAITVKSLYGHYLGLPGNFKADYDLYKGASKSVNNELGRLNDVLGNVNPAMKWIPANEAPEKTVLAMIDQYKTDVKNAQEKQAASEANAATSLTSKTQAEDVADTTKSAAQKAQKDAEAATLKVKGDKFVELSKAMDEITKLKDDLATAQKTGADDKVALEKKIVTLNKTLSDKDLVIQKIQAQLDVKRDDIVGTDKPKGKIIKVDNKAGIAYINIGSADFARPQLTFSILAPNAIGKGAGKRDRKGALEIVKVLDANMSQARIIDVTNSLQDPILEGDLLFNPAWDPSQREHVAIGGFIDLNGDGLDDTAEFVRYLTKQGVTVDAWLDLRDVQVKGPGMISTTSYLILGEIPQSDSSVQGGGAREQKKGEIRLKIQELKENAGKMGVPIVQSRNFLKMIGYPLPRISAPADFVPAGSIKAGEPGDKPADKKEEKPPEKKAPPKDDEEKK